MYAGKLHGATVMTGLSTDNHIVCIECNESGYEAGLLHGKKLKAEIRAFIEFIDRDILKTNKEAFFKLSRELFRPYIPKMYRREMQGIADGAEVDFNHILLINTYDDIMALLACSSIAVLRGNRADTVYHGRNLDYSVEYLSGKTIVLNYKKNGLTCIAFPGYIGGVTCVNTHGISMSSHMIPQTDNYKTSGIPSGILYRMTIEKAASIEEAIAILSHKKRANCNNILICSASENKSAVAEFYPNKIITRYSDEKGIISTNHRLTVDRSYSSIIKPFKSLLTLIIQIAGKIKYKLYNFNAKQAEAQLKEFIAETSRSSHLRYKILDLFLRKPEKKNLEAVKAIMHAAAQKGPESFTSTSVVFMADKREIHIASKKTAPVTGGSYFVYKY